MGAKALLSVLPVLLKKQMQEKTYRVYVTDALKFITENTAKYAGGSYMKIRYLDTEDPKPEEISCAYETKNRLCLSVDGEGLSGAAKGGGTH